MPTISKTTGTLAGVYHPLDIHTDVVEEWVAALPLANLGETCRLIFTSLTAINAADAAVAHRFKALEHLRDTLRYLDNVLTRRYVGTAFPLPAKTRKVAVLLGEMQLEMAKGYQAIARQILLQNGLRQDADTLVAALHRGLYYHGQALLTGYQIYQSPTAQQWREIYGLYKDAERMALQLSPVKDSFKNGSPITTVSDMFKHILLLALADPLRLTQQEMIAAYLLLEQTAGQSQLYTTTDYHDAGVVFTVDLDSDSPPVHVLFNGTAPTPTSRVLDPTALGHSLRGLLTDASQDSSINLATGAEMTPAKLPRPLLQRLLAAWGATAKRGFTRSTGAGAVTVQFGLSASHEAAEGAYAAEAYSSSQSTVSYRCDVVNESAVGACLSLQVGDSPRVRVGELLTVRHDSGGTGHWGIGAVRWLSQAADHIRFGIQMLVPSAAAITLRLADKAEGERDYLKGLLLQPVPPRETAETLLAPAFVYRAGDIVAVRDADRQERRCRLVRALESTQVYSRFQFEPLAGEELEADQPAPSRREREFDSVWSGL